ncbi:MAG TPA: 2-succinyl-5-enolpyruvyl-6-hydroxy-3-cyclohexene-1-carboxylic-acid synthase [Anaerolineales bacterium]|nr:2-succinyl-5-enolpyruvyl-6-hydroxy-3-cyclohexene-1-carboxylic-acid synthase [Anaerolineales bacterium]
MGTHTSNPSWTWASTLADELGRCGVSDIVIAPGSRSTPLALAFARLPGFRILSLLDERGAAFFALGLALASGRPAAVLCTSGTAAANLLPAVVEAGQAGVPLVALTADRPPELRGTGANQTVDQVGLYGSNVRFAADLLPPQSDPDPLVLRYLRTTVDRAIAAAVGPVPGPVHLNIPFRKPLEPEPGQRPSPAGAERLPGKPFTEISLARPAFELPPIAWPPRGLILAGPTCPGGDFPEALVDLGARLGYPIVADGLSGVRFGPWTRRTAILNPRICAGFAAGRFEMPEIVLQFGGVPTSAAPLGMLALFGDAVPRVSVQTHGVWRDDAHGLARLVSADPADFCRRLAAALPERFPEQFPERTPDHGWAGKLAVLESDYWKAVDEVQDGREIEGLLLADVAAALPDGGSLFIANSLPVRHLDEFVRPVEKRLRVFCNRGASGIDGTISTALGVAAGTAGPLVLVLGDLAFYHDLNGLLAVRRLGVRASIVLIHNDGGGVFRRLPIADHGTEFRDLFLTPHGLDFEPAVRMFGIDFERVPGRRELRTALDRSIAGDRTRVIEIRTDSAEHESFRTRVETRLQNWNKNPSDN